jgi:N-acetylglucosaminyl-diphospho-decaprenol L-rhamnosyltransferase
VQGPRLQELFDWGGEVISEQGAFDRDDSDILVSIVNHRTAEHCLACLTSMLAEKELIPGLQVVVADGASGDDSVGKLQSWISANGRGDWISVLPLSINGGFGWAHNQVMLRSFRSDSPPAFIHLLNPDTRLEPGAISALREVFDSAPRIACAGSQLINESGGLQPAGFHLPNIRTELARGGRATRIARALGAPDPVILPTGSLQVVPAVSGASFMVRMSALHEVGLFDHGFFLYFEEFEWMHRFARHGWKIVHEPRSRVHHIGGASTKLSRDSKVLARAPRPFYWYQSQRRCLYRLHGPFRARIAALAWLVGYVLIALPRAAVSRGFRSNRVKNEGPDMLRAWLTNERFDRQAFIPLPGDTIDQPPAWQTRRK